MHQRDYILRIIEQLGAVLAAVRRRILRRENATTIDAALSNAAEQAGFDMKLLRGFSLSSLRMFLGPGGDVEPARCWLMAEVLYLDGLQASLEERDDDAYDSLIKARSLYDLIRPAGGMLVGMPEASERISEIDKLLEGPSGPRSLDPTAGSTRRRRARTRRPGSAALSPPTF